MNRINKIKISYVKGIKDEEFVLDLIPNKPSILVAPNGFGKSSFATAFDSLKESGLVVDKKYFYMNSSKYKPILNMEIEYDGIKKSLKADDSTNNINGEFGVFVINSQLCAKAKSFGAKITASSLGIKDVKIIEKVPSKETLEIDLKEIKNWFGTNSKILPNVKEVLSNKNIVLLYEKVDVIKSLLGKRSLMKLREILDIVNNLEGSTEQVLKEVNNNLQSDWIDLDICQKIFDIVGILKFSIQTEFLETANFLLGLQLVHIYEINQKRFSKVVKYNIAA